MNFLAHACLSGGNEKIMAGNFIGDFVKGRKYLEYDGLVRLGILLHREIDSYSDAHSVFKQSKARLLSEYGHYSGVLVDMFYDHLLAKNFSRLFDQPLLDFTDQLYENVETFVDPLPERAAFVFPYIKRDNWLFHYQYEEGLKQALTGMARRTSFKSNMQYAITNLKRDHDLFQKEFLSFYSAISKHVEKWLSQHGIHD
jgi:acyl carrier protein phosphodiesterase